MSGFFPVWLAAREPWDHRARSSDILAALKEWRGTRPESSSLAVTDLGCGTGSTTRYLSEHLAAPLHWKLVDGDANLLRIAADELATTSNPAIETTQAELSPEALPTLMQGSDLVTASALLDLVSEAWLKEFWRAVEIQRTAVLAGLTYDGRLALSPNDPSDGLIRNLVNRHQQTDKGLGPALGPHATAALAVRARRAGWRVMIRRSDWKLTARHDGPGAAMLLDGWAAAAQEIAPGLSKSIQAWRDRRAATDDLTIIVGHRDLLALPPD
jgi:SAM-dependent methyltransferase